MWNTISKFFYRRHVCTFSLKNSIFTEHVGVAITCRLNTREVVGSNLCRYAVMTKGLRDFPQSLQPNAMMISRLGHDNFLPNPFKFIIHRSSHHITLYSPIWCQPRKINSIHQTTVFHIWYASMFIMWEPPTVNQALPNHRPGTIRC
jgi:hypothetical protein